MANPFKDKLNTVVKTLSSLFSGEETGEAKDEFTLQCEECDRETAALKEREHELYADIGVLAIDKYGTDDFGELGASFEQLQEQLRAVAGKKAELIRAKEEAERQAEEARKAAEEAARLAEEARKAEEARSAAAAPAAPAGASTCPVCGYENTPGMKFCGECGARLIQPSRLICPVCGYENAQGTKFCGECGTRLEAPAHVLDSKSLYTAPAQPAFQPAAAEPAEDASATMGYAAPNGAGDASADDSISETDEDSAPV